MIANGDRPLLRGPHANAIIAKARLAIPMHHHKDKKDPNDGKDNKDSKDDKGGKNNKGGKEG